MAENLRGISESHLQPELPKSSPHVDSIQNSLLRDAYISIRPCLPVLSLMASSALLFVSYNSSNFLSFTSGNLMTEKEFAIAATFFSAHLTFEYSKSCRRLIREIFPSTRRKRS